MIKKTLALALSAIMLGAVVVGCGNNSDDKTSPAPSSTTSGAPATTSAGGSDESPEPTTTGDNAGGGAPQTSKDNILNISVATSPETCDPTKNSSVDGAIYSIHGFEGLFRYKWDGSGVEYGVAESHEVNEDGTVWTFKLRDDAKWSDGQPVTAQDFEYTWKRLVDPATAAHYAEDMGHYMKNAAAIMAEGSTMSIDELGVKAIDEKTFEVTLENPTPYFDEICAFPCYYPVRQDVVEADPDKWWTSGDTAVTNGAFTIDSYTLDDKLILVPNEEYWDKDNVVAKTLQFWFMERDAITTSFKSGELEFGGHALVEETDALLNEGVLDVRKQLGTYYLSFNTQKAPFDDANVRKAFYYAIDADYISEVTINGLYSPTKAIVGEGFTDVGGADFMETGKQYKDNSNMEENKKIAQDALAEAGYPNGEDFPKVEYMFNTDSLHASIAEAMQQQWKEVLNVDVTLAEQEWATFQDTRRKGNFEIARNGWIADYNDPSTMLALFMSDSGNNDGKFSNEGFDAAMKKAFEQPERNEEYFASLHEAQDILMEEAGCAPLFNYQDDMLVNKDLKDWGFTPLGYKFFHKAYMATW